MLQTRIFDVPKYAGDLEKSMNLFFKNHPKAELMMIKEIDDGNKLLILYEENVDGET